MLEKVLALKLVCDLAVRHDTTILCTTILVNIHHSYRSLHLLLLRLDINCPLKLARSPFGTLPENGILPERSFGNIAFLDAPYNAIATIIVMRISRLSSFERCLGHLAFCVSHVNFELLCFGLVHFWNTSDGSSTGFQRRIL